MILSITRCLISLYLSKQLLLFAFEHGESGDILVQKAPACTIQTQAEAVCELFGGNKKDIKVIGIRHERFAMIVNAQVDARHNSKIKRHAYGVIYYS